MRIWIIPAAAFGAVMLAGAARAVEEPSGRYTMTPAQDGVVRLDTETGEIAICANKDGSWSCKPVPGGEAPALLAPPAEVQLPSEEDVDKAFDYVERMMRKIRERVKKLEETEPQGTPL